MPRIIVDSRESRVIVKNLKMIGSQVIDETITPADYIISKECAVERKGFKDFLRSIFDGRLFEQTQRLATIYKNPYLVVEGMFDQGLREISNPLIFWGALARIASEGKLSIIFTPNEKHTAMFLHSLAKKLQDGERRRSPLRRKPKIYTLREQQLLTAQALPNIGPERAERLLKHFGSLRRVFTASDTELLSVKGLGKKIVMGVKELLDTKYPGLNFKKVKS